MLTLFALALPLLASSPPQRYGVARIVSRDGYPVLLVRGKPFFIWGAAFFYERIPRSQWRSSLLALQRLHVNTLDLYVPWNWHELADGDFDFDGRTDPRRDLRALLQLANELGFYLIVRPGPVIRNEWRNGGYPAWLLRRPEYGMPLHDVLEGRYPATATLQNTRSDDAASQWLRNSTHLRYAQRWLRRVLAEFRPVAGRVLAVGLDDDQGAYLTNQTWPAPHLATYLQWLAAIVHDATNPSVPVFINTYQMKVPASSPVWAMGNWYQNSPGSMGEAERLQVLFSTALLGTRPRQPIVLSEFQAGWLLAPEDIYPHETDPTDTMLALHTALDAGARGVVDFPMQDALSPPGWEAPFANRFYDWGAALSLDGKPSPRYAPTLAFGNLVAQDGPLLATTHCVADAAIVWWPSALSMPPTEMQTNAIADATLESERRCLDRELSCALVDLRFATDDELRRYRALILPELPPGARESAFARTRLQRFARAGIVLRSWNDPALRVLIARRAVRGLPGATLHVGPGRLAFLDAVNYGTTALRARITVRYSTIRRHLVLELPARSARLVRLDRSDLPVRASAPEPATREAGVPIRWGLDAPVSSVGAVVLQDARARRRLRARRRTRVRFRGSRAQNECLHNRRSVARRRLASVTPVDNRPHRSVHAHVSRGNVQSSLRRTAFGNAQRCANVHRSGRAAGRCKIRKGAESAGERRYARSARASRASRPGPAPTSGRAIVAGNWSDEYQSLAGTAPGCERHLRAVEDTVCALGNRAVCALRSADTRIRRGPLGRRSRHLGAARGRRPARRPAPALCTRMAHDVVHLRLPAESRRGASKARARRAPNITLTGEWRNGLRSRLKSDRAKVLVGSNPTSPTKSRSRLGHRAGGNDLRVAFARFRGNPRQIRIRVEIDVI